MKRKVIQLAGKTLVVSLPHLWVKKHGVKKGHDMELQEKGTNILLSIQSMYDAGSTSITINKEFMNRIHRCILFHSLFV